MSHVNPRTGRYADDFPSRLAQGTATVQDLLDHAQEIIVEAPEVWGTVVTEPVRLLLAIYAQQQSALDVPRDMPIRDLEAEL